jgi:hypothetical protein
LLIALAFLAGLFALIAAVCAANSDSSIEARRASSKALNVQQNISMLFAVAAIITYVVQLF